MGQIQRTTKAFQMGNFVVYGRLNIFSLLGSFNLTPHHKKQPISGTWLEKVGFAGGSTSAGGQLFLYGSTLVIPGGKFDR